MTQLHERKASNIESKHTIEPATGEKKEKLERNCTEYLKKPLYKIGSCDFLDFTRNMIQLIGGKRHNENGLQVISSNPLEDKETQTSIVLHEKATTDHEFSSTEIVATPFGTNMQEALVGVFFTPRPTRGFGIPQQQLTISSLSTPEEYNSYITGEKETGSKTIAKRTMEPEEARGVARRVFEVYQRQGQQPQPPPFQS